MGLLRPQGYRVEIGGETHNLLFTLRAVEEIEEHYNMPVAQVIERLADDETVLETAGYLITVLVNDSRFFYDKNAEPYEEEELLNTIPYNEIVHINKIIIDTFLGSFPQKEDEDPNRKRSRRKSTSAGSSTSGRRDLGSHKMRLPE